MSDVDNRMAARVHRVTVGRVPLVADESDVLVVALVQRTWTPKGRRPTGSALGPSTRSRVGVEVRREPSTSMGDPGAMSPSAALALSRALAAAGRQADKIGAAPLNGGAAT